MQLPAISSAMIGANRAAEHADTTPTPAKIGEASQQFEAIMLRQFLGESMKSLLDGGSAGQVYGYMLTDTLADSLSKGGGLGLSSVIQAQLNPAKAGKGHP